MDLIQFRLPILWVIKAVQTGVLWLLASSLIHYAIKVQHTGSSRLHAPMLEASLLHSPHPRIRGVHVRIHHP
jgi:hypothetical protein